MFNPVPSSSASIQPATDAPAAREVTFEIGVILAAHLALALVVTVVLRTFGEF